MTDASFIDNDRTICLCDTRHTYWAATAVDADGAEHFVLARVHDIGDESVTVDVNCTDVAHEQLGPLPDFWTDRIKERRK